MAKALTVSCRNADSDQRGDGRTGRNYEVAKDTVEERPRDFTRASVCHIVLGGICAISQMTLPTAAAIR